jgi:hypothetical protein
VLFSGAFMMRLRSRLSVLQLFGGGPLQRLAVIETA